MTKEWHQRNRSDTRYLGGLDSKGFTDGQSSRYPSNPFQV